MQVELRAERVREAVTGAEAFLECDRAHHRGLEHRAARGEVMAVVDGVLEVRRDEPDAFVGDGVGHGVVAEGAVGLDAVGERVHAGGGGGSRGHRLGHLGIQDGDVGHQAGREDDGLLLGGLDGDHAAASHLAPGACRGGDGDHRRHVARDLRVTTDRVVILRQRHRMRDGEAHELCDVERAPAPDADHQVRVGLAVGVGGGEDLGLEWVRGDAVEDHALEARFLQERDQGIDEAGAADARIRDEEGAGAPEILGLGRQRVSGILAEEDAGGEAPDCGHENRSNPSGISRIALMADRRRVAEGTTSARALAPARTVV